MDQFYNRLTSSPQRKSGLGKRLPILLMVIFVKRLWIFNVYSNPLPTHTNCSTIQIQYNIMYNNEHNGFHGNLCSLMAPCGRPFQNEESRLIFGTLLLESNVYVWTKNLSWMMSSLELPVYACNISTESNIDYHYHTYCFDDHYHAVQTHQRPLPYIHFTTPNALTTITIETATTYKLLYSMYLMLA